MECDFLPFSSSPVAAPKGFFWEAGDLPKQWKLWVDGWVGATGTWISKIRHTVSVFLSTLAPHLGVLHCRMLSCSICRLGRASQSSCSTLLCASKGVGVFPSLSSHPLVISICAPSLRSPYSLCSLGCAPLNKKIPLSNLLLCYITNVGGLSSFPLTPFAPSPGTASSNFLFTKRISHSPPYQVPLQHPLRNCRSGNLKGKQEGKSSAGIELHPCHC